MSRRRKETLKLDVVGLALYSKAAEGGAIWGEAPRVELRLSARGSQNPPEFLAGQLADVDFLAIVVPSKDGSPDLAAIKRALESAMTAGGE
jgi:hypothetical protein